VAWAAWKAGRSLQATGRIHLGTLTVERDDSLPPDVAELRAEYDRA
jgi:hypothetical protein